METQETQVTGAPTRRRSRRWTRTAERRQWVESWRRSEQTQKAFARAHGFSISALRRWIQEQSDGKDAPVVRPLALKEISLEEVLGRGAPDEARGWEFEIRLSAGLAIAVSKGATATRIREVVEALRC